MVRHEDHGPLLDRDRDSLCGRVLALLPRLHVFPALSTVVDIGGTSLDEALDRAGADGDVLVVTDSADALDRLRAHCLAPNVFFLLGTGDVLPFPDASVDVVLNSNAAIDVERVLRAP